MTDMDKVARLADEFAECEDLLFTLGDRTRLHLIVQMMRMGECNGLRVGEITERTDLSRPAVSHHLQIMKDSGLVKVRREGTRNYYYFDPEMAAFARLVDALRLAMEIAAELPDRSGSASGDSEE